MAKKNVYFFGDGKAQGTGAMKNLLGGKGANLADMSSLGIPVPAGFTITTEVCSAYYANKGKLPKVVIEDSGRALRRVEKVMGKKFGSTTNPLLLSVRSGARQSMPGMMDTVLNVGLSSKTLPGLIAKTGDARFVYDAYRRLITMYADVVMEKAAGIEPKDGESVRGKLEHTMDALKEKRGVTNDADLSAEDLKALSEEFKRIVKQTLKKSFPDDANKQLWGAIKAVFQSWSGRRAIAYRRIEGIPEEWGTAVNVQAMVFGNMGGASATGVAFTRNPATGENLFYGEWLQNAQGEDVVAGTRTPSPLNNATKTDDTRHMQSLEESNPKVYRQLVAIRNKLEKHYRDMQDIEFTVEHGTLWMLQTRTGKRTGGAAIRIAVEMAEKKWIDRRTAIMRVDPNQLDELLHPMLDPASEKKADKIARGLPAGPGAGVGQIVFTADAAAAWHKDGKTVILVRNETSPEDVHGMYAAAGILTAKGGMTSHAALVARGWGKCCIVGCSALLIDAQKKTISVDGKTFGEGAWISLNGSAGIVYDGQLDVLPADPEKNKWYKKLMSWADDERQINVRTNAESPADAAQAIRFGAEGIGLARTEHMFFDPKRIVHVREMILADNEQERRKAVMKLLPYQRRDFVGIFKAMDGKPVTIRLLDPPLHEFLTMSNDDVNALAKKLNKDVTAIHNRIHQLHEFNPMLGHRGCRLGITYPEITEMQARAILEAAAECTKKKIKVFPEIMIPLVGHVNEYINQATIIRKVAKDVQKEKGIKLKYLVGTMIEIPRACFVADKIAEHAEFFSFGTNDLTQMGFGYSRDDAGTFLPEYVEREILDADPFQTIDQDGIGELLKLGVERGRSTRPNLKIGICGEHGGDPESVKFCHRIGLDYVSCSPFRVPIARFAAAQAAIETPRKKAAKKTRKKTTKKK
ncbi:MAG: pyruvate, phosphate dikinase [Candidatus Hydrogenedentes bacterium]|nr:pyruvate, phosphate dikinase [Candidatus Hydrogenedentota bacterium]